MASTLYVSRNNRGRRHIRKYPTAKSSVNGERNFVAILHAQEKVRVHKRVKDNEKDIDWWLCRPYKTVGATWHEGYIKVCHLQKFVPAPVPPVPAPVLPAPAPVSVTPASVPATTISAPEPVASAPKENPPQPNIIPTPTPDPHESAPVIDTPATVAPAPTPDPPPPPPNITQPEPILVSHSTPDKRNRQEDLSSTNPFKIICNRRAKRTNDWKNPYLRLATLKTIIVTNLWKDVPKHGTTLSRQQQALNIWKSTCDSLGVRVVMVTQWKTVATQAVRWVKRWFSHSETEANKTGHGHVSGEEDEVHPCVQDLAFRFRNSEDQDQYFLLLEELASQLQTNSSEAAVSAKNKQQEKLKQQNLISAGTLARQRALSRQATVALGGTTIDLSTSDKNSVITSGTSTPPKSGREKNELGHALNSIVLIMERRMTAQAAADEKQLKQRQIEFKADLEHRQRVVDLEERKLVTDRKARLLDVMLKNGIDPATALGLLDTDK